MAVATILYWTPETRFAPDGREPGPTVHAAVPVAAMLEMPGAQAPPFQVVPKDGPLETWMTTAARPAPPASAAVPEMIGRLPITFAPLGGPTMNETGGVTAYVKPTLPSGDSVCDRES